MLLLDVVDEDVLLLYDWLVTAGAEAAGLR
jgi:hypothetical protein